jgi:RNA polymerase sigma factor (sigma-70 family)
MDKAEQMQGTMPLQMIEKRQRNVTEVIKEYNRKLFAFIRGRVSNNADAEDILQDVWYQLSRVANIDSIEQISAWLYRVARNRLTDKYRKQKMELIEDQIYEDEDGDLFLKDILRAENPSPEEENLKELFWEALLEALEELPENQKEVFIWNELEDQTFQEIADRTGENIKTLISRKRYAVQHLRKRLDFLYKEFQEL